MSINGSGNGHDPDHKKPKGKVIRFPSLAERDRIKRAEREEEARWRAEYRKLSRSNRGAGVPFFNFGHIPPFTRTLVMAFLIVHLPLYLLYDQSVQYTAFSIFGFTPGMYTGAMPWSWWGLITPITYAFLHGSWTHLLFNGIMGLVLTMFFEKLFGTRTTAIFFIICVLAGALTYLAFSPFAIAPVVGASSGISGLFAALIYITLTQQPDHPLSQRMGKYGPWPVIVFWGAIMVLPALVFQDAIAWQAHLGGYTAGIALLYFMQKGKIRI